MKIYNVQILNDISNNYQGLDDTEIFSFVNLEDAKAKLAEECDKAIELFEDVPEDMLNIERDEMNFSIDDENDYVHGRIKEAEIDLDIYSITTVSVDPYEPAAVSTYYRNSKEEAHKEYNNLRKTYLDSKEEWLDEDETIDDFICEHVKHDYEFTNGGVYFHAVEEGGEEFIIDISKVDNK